MAGKSKPGKIHLRIIDVMKGFPGGISGGQIRHELEKEGLEPGEQTHLDRRKRDLKKWFVIRKELATILVNGKNRKVALYKTAVPCLTQTRITPRLVRPSAVLRASPKASRSQPARKPGSQSRVLLGDRAVSSGGWGRCDRALGRNFERSVPSRDSL